MPDVKPLPTVDQHVDHVTEHRAVLAGLANAEAKALPLMAAQLLADHVTSTQNDAIEVIAAFVESLDTFLLSKQELASQIRGLKSHA